MLYNLLDVLSSDTRLRHITVECPGTIFFLSTCDSLGDSLKGKIKDVSSNDLIEDSGIEVEVIYSSDEAAWGDFMWGLGLQMVIICVVEPGHQTQGIGLIRTANYIACDITLRTSRTISAVDAQCHLARTLLTYHNRSIG
jgi:hypothetical protein